MNSGPVRDNAAHAAAAPSEAPLLKLKDFLPHRLNVLSSLVSQALTRVYGRYGIGIPEWRGVGTLRENGGVARKAGGAPTHKHKNKNSRAGGQPPGGQIPSPPAQPPPPRGSLLF